MLLAESVLKGADVVVDVVQVWSKQTFDFPFSHGTIQRDRKLAFNGIIWLRRKMALESDSDMSRLVTLLHSKLQIYSLKMLHKESMIVIISHRRLHCSIKSSHPGSSPRTLYPSPWHLSAFSSTSCTSFRPSKSSPLQKDTRYSCSRPQQKLPRDVQEMADRMTESGVLDHRFRLFFSL